jgi:poly(ADP-ribose) glycohydrolase
MMSYRPPQLDTSLTTTRESLLATANDMERNFADYSEDNPPDVEAITSAVFRVMLTHSTSAKQAKVTPEKWPALTHALRLHLTTVEVASPARTSFEESVHTSKEVSATVSTSTFYRVLITMLRAVAQHMPSVSALTTAEAGIPGACHRSFTKLECFAVLSASFFNLFSRSSHDCLGSDGYPSMNLDEMQSVAVFADCNSVEVAKLRMFLDYYVESARRVDTHDPIMTDPEHAIVFVRVVQPAMALEGKAAVGLAPCEFHKLGESIDEARRMLRADFANAIIGGASLSFGCVQEEITFSICPEMNVSRLICTPMADTEAILIFRGEQFSRVRPGTYAFSLQYGGPASEREHARTSAVAAIDALDYRGQSSATQYSRDSVVREVVKAAAGFGFDERLVPAGVHVPKEIATGNWGCGAFRGDPELKLLEQWIACSIAGRVMHYFPFNDERLAKAFPKVQARIKEGAGAGGAPVTALDLLRCLASGKLRANISVFDSVLAALDEMS